MKQLFFAAMAAMAMLCSCSKQNDEIIELSKGGVVNISFTDDNPTTRAFFGTTAAAETWEKTLSSITVYAFNSSGNLLVRRQFTSTELANKSASFALPGATVADNCEFYAVANTTIASVTTKSALLTTLESAASEYNGTFAEVSGATKRAAGFVMSGSATQAIAAKGSTTSVAITLKRSVAKVAIETVPSADFGSKYSGAIRVNSAKIIKAATQSLLIKPATPNTGAMNFTHTQNSNFVSNKYQNLFYLFENGALAAGARVAVELNATYDSDGNFATTTDQAPMSYTIELDGNANGIIARNGYYRLAVSITGLSGNDATLSVTVADWETPVTQTVNVGM